MSAALARILWGTLVALSLVLTAPGPALAQPRLAAGDPLPGSPTTAPPTTSGPTSGGTPTGDATTGDATTGDAAVGDAAMRDAAAERAEADAAFIGRPIRSIAFDCDLDLCRNPVAVERFKELTGMFVGQPFDPRNVRRAQERLAKTGFFRALEVHKELSAGGVYLTIDAHGATLIRRVSFEGLSPPPFESELRKLLIFRPGQVYVEDDDRAMAQLQSLEALYEREGYFGTKIHLLVQKVDDQDHLVDLVFRVEKGEPLKICDIGLRGVRAMSYSEARALLLTNVSVFARRVPLFPPRFTTHDYRAGRDALIRHYRELGHFRARIVDEHTRTDHDAGCVAVLLDINEGPRWTLAFEGHRIVGEDELRAQLPFYETGYVDREEINRAQNAIRKLYETRGYPFARVRGTERVEDSTQRHLDFEIVEGPRLQIDSVHLHGNASIPASRLMEGFGTQAFGLFDAGGYLQTDQLLSDIARLEAVYREEGYLQATVERFTLEVTPRGDALRVHLYIDEGVQTRVERVDITGARTVPTGTLQAMLGVGAGRPFVPLEVRADQSRIMQRYSTFGHPLARVSTSCRLLTGEEVACEAPQLPAQCRASSLDELVPLCEGSDAPGGRRKVTCQRIRPEAHCTFQGGATGRRIRVRHHIEEGPRVRVGEVLLKGNFDTKSDVIYRELPLKTGELFDVSKVLEGQGNMRSLGLFDSVSIEAIGLEDSEIGADELTAALIISVEESRSRYLDFKVGLEGRDLFGESRRLLFTGEMQYNDNNLFGRGQRFRPRIIGAVDTFDLYRIGRNATSELDAAQEFIDIDYVFGAELIYNHPRFLKALTNVDKLYLTITPFYMLDLLGVTNDQVLREEWGLRLELRKELFELADRLFVSFGVEAKQAATWTPSDLRLDGERIFSPRRTTGKLLPELSFDRRDSPLNPRTGYYLQVKPHLVSGDALGQGAEDAIDDSYLRLMVNASAYIRLSDDIVLGQGLRMGQIVPLFGRQNLVPPDERFFLGGVGSVRGFPTNALGPIGNRQQALGGEFMLNYSLELRYPLLRALNLHGAVFFDAGVLTNCFGGADASGQGNTRSTSNCYRNAFPEDDSLSQIRTSAGIGLRYLVADQIPLLFDYGIVLNRRPGEGFGSLHFNLGYSF